MTYTLEQARFIGVAIATTMNELDVSLTLPLAEGVVRPNPESKTPRKKKAKPKASMTPAQRAAEMPEAYRRALKESKKAEPKAPAKKKASSPKKKDPLAPRKSQSKTAKPKRRSPKENSRIVHEVNGYIGMATKAKTQAGARIWLLKATKATPSGWTATHNQIARHHAKNCPDIAA